MLTSMMGTYARFCSATIDPKGPFLSLALACRIGALSLKVLAYVNLHGPYVYDPNCPKSLSILDTNISLEFGNKLP